LIPGFFVWVADRVRTSMSKRTQGELLFEEYLRSVGITEFDFEPDIPGCPQKPDYRLVHEGSTLLLDVKDFVPEAEDFGVCGAYDPYVDIRGKIAKGRQKFKNLKDYPCALVLYNCGKPLVDLSPEYIYGSMLGDLGISFPIDTETGIGDIEKTTAVFGQGGKMFRYDKENKHAIAPRNTTISAVIALRYLPVGQKLCSAMVQQRQKEMGRRMTMHETFAVIKTWSEAEPDPWRRQLHAVVCENPVARKPWARTLFNGEWDERYGGVDAFVRRLSAGQALRDWERLTEQQPEFPDV
jgi:hypothetical protein